MLLKAELKHGNKRCVWLGLEIKAYHFTHSCPMSVSYARVAKRLQDRQVLFKLVQFHFEGICGLLGQGQITECLGEFVHGTPHITNLIINFLCI